MSLKSARIGNVVTPTVPWFPQTFFLTEGRKPAPLSTAKAARPVGTRRGKQKRTQPQLRSASSLRGRTGVALARASPTARLSGCYSAPELFMISAPMSFDTPKASLCSAYQGSSPGDEKRRAVQDGRGPECTGSRGLASATLPRWRRVALAFAPSLAPLIPAQQPEHKAQ